MVALLREDALLPPTKRRWLKDFIQPRVEANVGVSKPGLQGVRYADVLIIEERPARAGLLASRPSASRAVTSRPLR